MHGITHLEINQALSNTHFWGPRDLAFDSVSLSHTLSLPPSFPLAFNFAYKPAVCVLTCTSHGCYCTEMLACSQRASTVGCFVCFNAVFLSAITQCSLKSERIPSNRGKQGKPGIVGEPLGKFVAALLNLEKMWQLLSTISGQV